MDSSLKNILSSSSNNSLLSIFKKELLLGKNDFNQQDSRTDKSALAQTIQNLLFVEKGTYPNQPDIGVGIQNYQFEFLDNITINRLNESIKYNIDRFIETDFNISNEVQALDSVYGKVLAIYFSVSDNINNSIKEEFAIVVGTNSNKKVVSKIIV